MPVKDLFSSRSDQYAAFRPDYPSVLFDFLFQHVTDFSSAWDCGTGNGQAAKELAKRFDYVFATDISATQLTNATKAPNIVYSIASAEQSHLTSSSVGLITVAQAVHWFDRSAFYQEVLRVAKPNCFIALWGYGLLSVNPTFDALLNGFYKHVIGPYWDYARKHIDDRYANISFPFKSISTPHFQTIKYWNINHLAGYLSTWSAVKKYIDVHGEDPVLKFIESSQKSFGSGIQEVKFDFFMRAGKAYAE